jgi:Protein of unknown function (DUF1552)
MIITKKAIPRRTVLRGVGASLALPLLDCMLPAFTALTKAAAKPPVRFGVVYVPNGIIMNQWTPETDGAGFEFTPTLKPLEPFRDRLVLISGLDNTGFSNRKLSNGGPHQRAPAAYLTGIEPRPTTGTSGIEVSISMDQLAAQQLRPPTALPTLELSLESDELLGGLGVCGITHSCTYQGTLSWLNATTPMPPETNPRVVFERLFGDVGTTDPAQRRARMQRDQSILDFVLNEVGHLQRRLGPDDRAKFEQYLEAVRDIERRITNAEQQGAKELPSVESPSGIPGTWEEHANLMFDLQVLAFQTDLTRFITFMISREQSGMTYPQIGVPDSHHPISHHGGDREKIAKCAKINVYHTTLFARFLEKLRSTPDGDGSLLDQMMLMYGCGLSEGNQHLPTNLPILVAGGAGGQLKGGRHLRYPDGSQLTNLQLTMLHMLGVNVERFADSTKAIEGLTM